MNAIDRNQLIDQVLQQRRAVRSTQTPTPNLPVPVSQPENTESQLNLIPGETVIQGLAAAQPRLINETLDTLDRGFRRTQVFRQSDGRNFIRNEEVTLTERGMSRVVTQENPSGSGVRFEENIDRKKDGSFQRMVRFTDEIGAVQTKVDSPQNGIDPFILNGGSYTADRTASTADKNRGATIDFSV